MGRLGDRTDGWGWVGEGVGKGKFCDNSQGFAAVDAIHQIKKPLQFGSENTQMQVLFPNGAVMRLESAKP